MIYKPYKTPFYTNPHHKTIKHRNHNRNPRNRNTAYMAIRTRVFLELTRKGWRVGM